MSLKITSNKIIIQKPDGTTQFTSDNKLIYRKYLQQSTITLGASTIKESFYEMGSSEFLVITMKINSSTGNVNGNTGITGKTIPGNGSILVDVNGRAEGNSGACDIEFIGVNVCGSSLVFNSLRFNADGVMSKGTKTTELVYTAAIYSYL
jgi:hypothetical protein